MTDFSQAVLSLRVPMTDAPAHHPRASALLETRAAVFTLSPLSNPILEASSVVSDWPSTNLLSRMLRAPRRRSVPVPPTAYFQLAFPADAAPKELPDGVTLLGYDLTDGCDSYLIDYGETPAPLGAALRKLNEVGLLGWEQLAIDLAEAISRAWGLDRRPEVWALYRVDTL